MAGSLLSGSFWYADVAGKKAQKERIRTAEVLDSAAAGRDGETLVDIETAWRSAGVVVGPA